MPSKEQQGVRIRLAGELLREFRKRAAARASSAGEYADMIFRYHWYDGKAVEIRHHKMDESEEIYFTIELPAATRRRLTRTSELERVNLASLGGSIVANFLNEHERDPRDLALVHYVSSIMDEKGQLTEAELKVGVSHCEQNPNLRLPPGYHARWLAGRLGRMISEFDRAGERVPLSASALEKLLEP
jgi:hypothetical protein